VGRRTKAQSLSVTNFVSRMVHLGTSVVATSKLTARKGEDIAEIQVGRRRGMEHRSEESLLKLRPRTSTLVNYGPGSPKSRHEKACATTKEYPYLR